MHTTQIRFSAIRLPLIISHIFYFNQVPIVASTGGLVDTVKEGFTGFQMGSFNVEVIIPTSSFHFMPVCPYSRLSNNHYHYLIFPKYFAAV